MARNDVVEPVTLATSLIKEWWASAVARNEVVEPIQCVFFSLEIIRGEVVDATGLEPVTLAL